MNSKLLKISEMLPGHKFSELSHYTLVKKNGKQLTFNHHASGAEVTLSENYVVKYLKNAEQYQIELTVGREDKFWTQKQIDESVWSRSQVTPNVGDLRVKGIRTIWEELHSQQVFSVSYGVKSKETAAQLKARKQQAVDDIFMALGRPRTAWNSSILADYVAKVAMKALDNPVIKEGTNRVLRGYKVQFHSRDGKYNCVDMDIDNVHNVRPVNINTINWLVTDNVKYIVK